MPTRARRARGQEGQRRRAAVSCDYCKHRRAKCIRASLNESCSNCLAYQIKCQSTAPRKQRVYGSVETLSARYRALEAMVTGLLPEENTQNMETLYRVASERGIDMPPRDDMSHSIEIFAQPPGPHPASVRSPAEPATSSESTAPERNLRAGTSHPRPPVEEKMIPTPQGVAHYTGPSSSFEFITSLRSLVAQSGTANVSQKALLADFVNLRTSRALEVQEAPGDEDVQSGVSDSTALSPEESGHSQHVDSPPRPFVGTPMMSINFLPPRETADVFIRVFFERIHPDYPLFHRNTFQLRYESLWQSPIVHGASAKPDTAWMCILAMVFVFAAQALEKHDAAQATLIQKRYLAMVRSSLGCLIGTTGLLNVQALLLLQLYEHNAGQRNAAWMFLGAASRMAIALGMHREGATCGFDAVERETRRRVWWTLYVSERNLCVMLGRPSAIEDNEVSVSLPSDGDVDLPLGHAEWLVKLVRLSWQVKTIVHPPPQDTNLPSASSVQALLGDLEAWHRSLPAHLLPRWKSMIPQHRRAVLLLHIQYQYVLSLATRPFLYYRAKVELGQRGIYEDRQPPSAQDLVHLLQSCILASERSLDYIHQLADADLLNGVSWIDVYYTYHAVLILGLDLLASPSSPSVSETQGRRKEAVRSILDAAEQIPLAPTFRILILVAKQFAGIVGAVDASTARDPIKAGQSQDSVDGAEAAASSRSYQQNLVGQWLSPDLSAASWDSFDLGTHGMPFGNTFGDSDYYSQGPVFLAQQFHEHSTLTPAEGSPLSLANSEWAVQAWRELSLGRFSSL